MLKVATAGSDTEKQLLKAKKIFEDVYRDTKRNTSEEVQYGVSGKKLKVPNGYTTLSEQSQYLVNYSIPKEFNFAIIKDTDIVGETEFEVVRAEVFKKANEMRLNDESLIFKDYVYSANHIFWYNNNSLTDFTVTKIVEIDEQFVNELKGAFNNGKQTDGVGVGTANGSVEPAGRYGDRNSSNVGYRGTSTNDVRIFENGESKQGGSNGQVRGNSSGIDNEMAPTKTSQSGVFFDDKTQMSLSDNNQLIAPSVFKMRQAELEFKNLRFQIGTSSL